MTRRQIVTLLCCALLTVLAGAVVLRWLRGGFRVSPAPPEQPITSDLEERLAANSADEAVIQQNLGLDCRLD